MRKILLLILLFISCFLQGCTKPFRTFKYNELLEKVDSIYIVEIKGYFTETNNINVLNEISNKQQFIKDFCELEYHKYLGDPPTNLNDCILMLYKDNSFEIFCSGDIYQYDENHKFVSRIYVQIPSRSQFESLIEKYKK